MRTTITIGMFLTLTASACSVDPGDITNPGANGAVPDDSGSGAPDNGDTGTDAQAVTTPPTTPTATTVSTGPYFTQPMFFNTDVSTAPKAANSAAITAALTSAGGWGNSNKMQIDFGLDVLPANSSTPMKSFTPTDDFYAPDCDHTAMPVPAGGNLEEETGYACTGDGDCHLLVFDSSAKKLYEMYRANITSTFEGGCLAVWDARRPGPRACAATSAPAPTPRASRSRRCCSPADEVKAGHIDHAIRFILPNNRVKRGFVHPATHATDTTGGTSAPSYGVHFRLRADYPIANLKPGAQVVARAMQKYGMYPRRRRQHRADRPERSPHHGQVVGAARLDRPQRAAGLGLRGHRPRRADRVDRRLQPLSYACAVGRTTMSPTSTLAGCSIANAMARAIASGGIAISIALNVCALSAGLVIDSASSVFT